MNDTLTKYTSFEAMKADMRPATLSKSEKEQLDAEARQLAELMHTLRKQKYGAARK